jgi:hypothetical protein
MPSWLKLTLVALAAFGLGFAAARRFPPANLTSAKDLAWERVGDTVRLTAKTPGESYLIVEGGTASADPSPEDASRVGSSPIGSVTAETLTGRGPMLAYRLNLVLACSGGGCNPCLGGNDCPPAPQGPFGPIGGPIRGVRVWQPPTIAIGPGGRPPGSVR